MIAARASPRQRVPPVAPVMSGTDLLLNLIKRPAFSLLTRRPRILIAARQSTTVNAECLGRPKDEAGVIELRALKELTEK